MVFEAINIGRHKQEVVCGCLLGVSAILSSKASFSVVCLSGEANLIADYLVGAALRDHKS